MLRLVVFMACAIFCVNVSAEMFPPVDPEQGPVAGEVYVDLGRLKNARDSAGSGAQYDSVDALLASQGLYSQSDGHMDLSGLPLGRVIEMYFSEIARIPYVICSDVLADGRLVSLRASGRALDRAALIALLDVNGLSLRMIGGVATVCVKPVEERLTEEQRMARSGEVFSYVPKFRSADELIRFAQPLVVGVFAGSVGNGGAALPATSDRSSVAGSSAGSSLGGVVVFSGSKHQIERLEKILKSVDAPVQSVQVRAALYEVTDSDSSGSVLKVIGQLFGGKVGFSMGSGSFIPGSGGGGLNVSLPNFDFIAGILSEDSRFQLVSQPSVRVLDGRSARLQVGQDVPVTEEILFSPQGQATQSVQYHSSGTILDVTVHVRGASILLNLTQTLSDFQQNKIGSSDNPILFKRELQSDLMVSDGEIVVLGGLSDDKKTDTKSGFFGLNFAKSKNYSKSQLVLLLQAKKI